jgi:hypothetical protein
MTTYLMLMSVATLNCFEISGTKDAADVILALDLVQEKSFPF